MGPTVLESTLTVFMIGSDGQPHGELNVWLTWSADDPLAIFLSIPNGDIVINWQLSRELLCSGLVGPAGIGDVRVSPCWGYGKSGEEELEIRLYAYDSKSCARLIFAHSDVLTFLLDTDTEFKDSERRYIDLMGELLDAGWPS